MSEIYFKREDIIKALREKNITTFNVTMLVDSIPEYIEVIKTKMHDTVGSCAIEDGIYYKKSK